jgi:hypothetical protein
MDVVQMRCHGCNKVFTPLGYSQHIGKTRNMHCHTVHSASQAHLDLTSTDGAGHAVSSLAPILSSTLWSCNDLVDDRTSNEEMTQPLGGEFAMTCLVDV